MCGGIIDWAAFSWEAFATLTTGILAVLGAAFVGLRQADIAKEQAKIAGRQAEILSKQAGLDELKLRADLFDKRFAVYEAARKFIGIITAYAARPEDPEFERNFLIAKDQATFLFRKSVNDDLQIIWRNANAFFALKSVMDHTYRIEGHYGDGNSEKELEHMTWFAERISSLSELFGDELKLSPPAV